MNVGIVGKGYYYDKNGWTIEAWMKYFEEAIIREYQNPDSTYTDSTNTGSTK